jgi:hypothetical protein
MSDTEDHFERTGPLMSEGKVLGTPFARCDALTCLQRLPKMGAKESIVSQ